MGSPLIPNRPDLVLAISRLKKPFQIVLLLYYTEHLNVAQIAAVLRIEPKQAHQRLRLAHEALGITRPNFRAKMN